MANGLLGKCKSTANAFITVYTLSDATKISFGTVNILCVNIGATPALISVAITSQTTPVDSDFIEYNTELEHQSSILERTAIVCSPSEKIVIKASTDNVIVRVHGLEQAIC
jgi:hypothetical protein